MLKYTYFFNRHKKMGKTIVFSTDTNKSGPDPSNYYHHDGGILQSIDDSEIPHILNAECSNGFIGSLLYAYNKHIPLTIRPDDVWISIMAVFARYVCANAEQMRDKFVDHEGSKELKVLIEHTEISTIDKKTLEDMVHETILEILKNVKHDISWMICDFTTSSILDKMVSSLLVIGTTQKYFHWNIGTSCLFPQITLEGTLEDWYKLKEKCKLLENFSFEKKDYRDKTINELKMWSNDLIPVIDKFIQTYKRADDTNINDLFKWWNTALSEDVQGSGGGIHLCGWSRIFSPFAFGQNGECYYVYRAWKQIHMSKICSTSVTVPIKFELQNETKDMHFTAGLIGSIYDKDTNNIRIKPGWTLYAGKD